MTTLAAMASTRQMTLRTVMRVLLEREAVSRAELARLTGVSKQTMSEVFRELEEGGWVRRSGRTQGAVGRSAATYEVCVDRALVFGADVGGTKVQAALADMHGIILTETVEPTDPRGGQYVVDQLARMSAELAHRASQPLERVLVGTIGIPGAYNARTGKLFMVPNITGLEGTPFVEDLRERVDFDVHVGNDVNMAAKGEQWMGEGRNVDDFVFIALGTGIGMGIINERRVLSGAHGAAGEIATLPIGADPYDGRTFRSGGLETALGSAAIRERYEGSGGRSGLTVREIIDRIGDGDTIAAATVDAIARILAQAVLAVSAVLDPERVVLGGSVGARRELLERMEVHLPLCMPSPPQCTVSKLGSRAGLYGTIANSLDLLRDSLFQTPGLDIPMPRAKPFEVHP
ncbi:ROK family transcriptional regulator [Pelagibacterium montanilacus]|uniref:ROK family transcriptional regulator n=1 Tax=Pelagibacterium montanilacus TaxID=2185280 RepID=UPI000F8F784E|nr:ROK family transcriptional regulator [Pelagibacterium montanilacus]